MRYDIAVAGGGPAGLVAATILARAGASVLVAAPARKPEERPGETLPGSALRLLAVLNLPRPQDGGPHRRLTGIASAWTGPPVETDFLRSPDGPSWLLDRPVFDRELADAARAAGARIVPARMTARREGGGWAISRNASAAFLIDATGRPGGLARRLGARRVAEDPQIACWAVADGEAPQRLDRPFIERTTEGWWYAVRLSPTSTYAAYHVPPAIAAPAREPAEWRRQLRDTRYLWPLLETAGAFSSPRGAPAGGSRLAPPFGNGWAACGDAARAFDPLSSQGLLTAMAGGHMLAEAVLAGGTPSQLAGYAARLDEIGAIYGVRRRSFLDTPAPSAAAAEYRA